MVTIARSAVNKFLMLPLMCLLVTSCITEVPFPRCVSADNFSSSTTASVSAYYGPGNVEAFKAGDGQIGNASTPGANKHVVRWKDTGFITDGNEIVAGIEGAWVPWAKNGEKHSSPLAVNTGISRPVDPTDEFYDSVVDIERVCGPYEKRERTAGDCKLNCHHIPATDDTNKGQYGRPCWLNKGYGAYLLFKRPEDPDPNSTLDLIEYPVSPTTHLGHEAADESQDGKASYHSNGKIFGSDCKTVELKRGWKIYVKILDNYYYDNAGGYSLEFKQGVINGKGVEVFEYVRKLVRAQLNKAGEQIFSNIVKNPGFRNFTFAVMTLFLVISALAYLLGMVRAPLADAMVRIFKIILVILLVSPGSWEFFHDNLLQLFTKGVDQIIALVNSYAAKEEFKADAPFKFMDVMIGERIFSTVVWEAKARALIMADFSSIFALLIIIISVICYVALCLYGFVIYLTAFVGITFLIALMPIMFVGIVFSRFRSLFDGWLTQCISFSMQAILMFTLIAMFGSLIMHYYYRIFGFTACYNEVVHIKLYALGHRIIDQKYYEWTPGQKYDPMRIGWSGDSSKSEQGDSGTSARYTFTGGGAVIKVPPDHKDEDFRYVDFPFLDPDSESSAPPGGVSLIKKEDTLKPLASMTNSLIASARGTSTARLVNKIQGELEKRVQDKTVTSTAQSQFLDVIKKREEEDTKNKKDVKLKYEDPKFKEALVKVLTENIISRNRVLNPTSAEKLEKQHDYNIIKDLKKGYIVMWPEVFGLILVAFLVWQMRAFVQNVAVVLAGGSILSRTVGSMYSEGFVRIFSHIPVVGTFIDRIDRGIDGLRVLMRVKAGDLASSAAKVPENLLKRVPIVGGVLGTAAHGVRSLSSALTSSYTEEDLYSMRSISPRFDYARAWVGAHLGYSPLDAMKYMGKHALGRITGSETEGLIHNITQDRAAFLSSLHALTVGVEKHKPSEYAPAQKDDDSNPFVRPDLQDGGQNTDNTSQRLFDSDGKLHVNKDNFWDAVDTLHGLGALRANAEDPEARDKIDADMNKLRSEITAMANERPDEVPELANFVTPSGSVDFSGLVGHALARRDAEAPDAAGVDVSARPTDSGYEWRGEEQGADADVAHDSDESARTGISGMVDDALRAPDVVDGESDGSAEQPQGSEAGVLRGVVGEQYEGIGEPDEVLVQPEAEDPSRASADGFEDVLVDGEEAAIGELAAAQAASEEKADVQGEELQEIDQQPDESEATSVPQDMLADDEDAVAELAAAQGEELQEIDQQPDESEATSVPQDVPADGEDAAIGELAAAQAASEEKADVQGEELQEIDQQPDESEATSVPQDMLADDEDAVAELAAAQGEELQEIDQQPDESEATSVPQDVPADGEDAAIGELAAAQAASEEKADVQGEELQEIDQQPDEGEAISVPQDVPADGEGVVEELAAAQAASEEEADDQGLYLKKSDKSGGRGASRSEGGKKPGRGGREEDGYEGEELGYGGVQGDDYVDAKESGLQVGAEVYKAYTSKKESEGDTGVGEGLGSGEELGSRVEAAVRQAYSGRIAEEEGNDLSEILGHEVKTYDLEDLEEGLISELVQQQAVVDPQQDAQATGAHYGADETEGSEDRGAVAPDEQPEPGVGVAPEATDGQDAQATGVEEVADGEAGGGEDQDADVQEHTDRGDLEYDVEYSAIDSERAWAEATASKDVDEVLSGEDQDAGDQTDVFAGHYGADETEGGEAQGAMALDEQPEPEVGVTPEATDDAASHEEAEQEAGAIQEATDDRDAQAAGAEEVADGEAKGGEAQGAMALDEQQPEPEVGIAQEVTDDDRDAQATGAEEVVDDEFEDAVDAAAAGTEADVTLAALGSHRPEIGGKVASASQSTGKHTGSGGASKRQQQEERRKQMSALQERIVELQKALDSPNVTETDKQNIEAELSVLRTELDGLGGSSQ
ncbi:putative conjugal transfer protein [Anaplasma centrale str. Israel]|uniref:Putative conjugal transfer protein n=1 Tax=Anaplasma centrale (strain Israel) TaxID=574556 RepID=D1AUB3_ANACI|nr:type IV secretion system protein [Anaplasma centrale]ACZ49141.1 putative conjugal transfer protein [Anaplasma centrale str. Israel]